MPASFPVNQLAKLTERRNRVDSFWDDCEAIFITFNTGQVAHMDIEWDGVRIRVIETNAIIADEALSEKLKYYDQGLGLMKIVMNKNLYPEP